MTKRLSIGEGAEIDLANLIVTKLLVQANSGGGKSYAIRKLLEVTHGAIPQLVLDVEGEFHTLREKFDYVLFGPGGDYPISVETAAVLARRCIELGISSVIDISELSSSARQLYIKRFCDSIVATPRALWRPVMVVIDEAQKFAPEGKGEPLTKDDDDRTSLDAVRDLMTRGRKRGLLGVLATQRIANVDKTAAAECNNVLIGRTGLDVDMLRAGKTLGFRTEEQRRQLRKLHPGHFFAFGPALAPSDVMELKIGRVETTHPEAGKGSAVPPTPPRAEIRAVLAQLAGLSKEAEVQAKDDRNLQSQVDQLQRDLAAARAATPAPVERVIEKRIITDAEIGRLEAAATKADELSQRIAAVADELGQAVELLAVEVVDLRAAIHLADQLPNGGPVKSDTPRPLKVREPLIVQTPTLLQLTAQREASTSKIDQQDILDAIATLDAIKLPVTILTLAAWIGLHPKNNTLLKMIGVLRSNEPAMLDGLQLTPDGKAVARGKNPTAEEQRSVLSQSLDESQRRILDVAASFAKLGRTRNHAALALWCGLHPKNNNLLKDLGRLQSGGFLDGDKQLTALGKRIAQPKYAGRTVDQLLEPIDEGQRRIASVVIKRKEAATITDLAELVGLHPKNNSLLADLGQLRKRGLLTSGWPLKPTEVWP